MPLRQGSAAPRQYGGRRDPFAFRSLYRIFCWGGVRAATARPPWRRRLAVAGWIPDPRRPTAPIHPTKLRDRVPRPEGEGARKPNLGGAGAQPAFCGRVARGARPSPPRQPSHGCDGRTSARRFGLAGADRLRPRPLPSLLGGKRPRGSASRPRPSWFRVLESRPARCRGFKLRPCGSRPPPTTGPSCPLQQHPGPPPPPLPQKVFCAV